METEEGYTRACLYNKCIALDEFKHYSKFLGEEIEI
jgi:hypothetical protein